MCSKMGVARALDLRQDGGGPGAVYIASWTLGNDPLSIKAVAVDEQNTQQSIIG
jgi:hypothetical protein